MAADQWTVISTVGEVPIKRCLARGHLDSTTGRLLIFGGQTDTSPFLGDLWSLDIADGIWTELSPLGMPAARNLYGASATADGAWHLTGGNTPVGRSGEHWAYQPSLNTWQLGQALPARANHDAAILADRLYVFAGTDSTMELDDIWSRSLTQ
jgi:hypothetical protein